ncbi:MAG: FADH(2)-oxidizing methylenetetrahydrofolate--tRNA-(uracil(54)-C(5))-methyltransferase TrmFO [Chloroflexi bacterium]|nr:FADH(2)-oxidizing methylenetetrahydrofolate--tRNA-(uracil(54)-C(5))-methyltransferase TrmFO [Chloroflexota bacterium]
MTETLTIIGAGLAGSEAAWQAARRGIPVRLYEMRPRKMTPAHRTDKFAELVCSNSLGAKTPDRALGLLKEEMRRLDSLILRAAEANALPAGGALAVDREGFADMVTQSLLQHPLIQVIREEVTDIPSGPTIIATGPLTSDALAQRIMELTGEEYLYFYDALAPIVKAETINMDICFRASRYGRGEQEEGDYINCPFTKEEYYRFVEALLKAPRIQLRDFEREDERFFEACLPIEVIAERGLDSLAFGPMRPVGLIDPRTGKQPYAVVQLRQDNVAGTLYNLVGFQTNITWGAQKEILRMIPGLERAEFVRYGQMHRNTFINSPVLLRPTLQFKERADLFFAGQITGTEGYVGSTMGGLVAGINAARLLTGREPLIFPRTTMIGALLHYITHADPRDFQPMKANFGLLPPLERRVRNKRQRYRKYAERALRDLEEFIEKRVTSDE